jgi:hypothetical protein
VSDSRPLVFVHINKTAGTTLRYILRSSFGARHCDVEPWHGAWSDPPFSSEDLRRVRRLYPRLASIAGHRVTGYADLDEPGVELRYVTILREPVALCASRFQYQLDYRRKTDLVFEEWIQRDWVWNAQTKRIAGTSSADDAVATIERKGIFVGLTERFDESMVLLKALRAPELDISYEPVNVAKSSRVARDLLEDDVTRGLIEEANRADIELYGRVVGELYPSWQREFGDGLDEAVARARAERHGFNRTNLARYGLKQRAVHDPVVRLYRGRRTGSLVGAMVR